MDPFQSIFYQFSDHPVCPISLLTQQSGNRGMVSPQRRNRGINEVNKNKGDTRNRWRGYRDRNIDRGNRNMNKGHRKMNKGDRNLNKGAGSIQDYPGPRAPGAHFG